MTVNKIITPPSQKGVIDKINEVIDNLGGDSLPSQTGQSGKFLTTDGTDASWGVVQTHNLLEFMWSDHLLNDQSWLRADTFSWQNGTTYSNAYQHLVTDISGITAETETIGSYTITFYRATDGHKICLADQETTVANIYSETGVAWYYILDTTNTQFKLPRTKFGFNGFRNNVGDLIPETLPNILAEYYNNFCGSGSQVTGALSLQLGSSKQIATGNSWLIYGSNFTFDASRITSTYQNNAPVQERATQMYLYFYVGEFSQTATEQTAGLNSELFNNKLDIPTGRSQDGVGLLIESYVNGASWYRVYSDGWCEQGGYAPNGTTSITFLKEFVNANYTLTGSIDQNVNASPYWNDFGYNRTATGFSLRMGLFSWQACGYIV